MRSCLTVLCISVMAVTASAATDLPATISSDTTLSASGSPYQLVSDVMIPAGITLTINGPAQIVSQGDFRLFIYGTLEGAGLATKRLAFRAADGSARGAWQGLYVARGGCCNLRYSTVKNAATNIMCAGGTVALDHSTVALASGDGLWAWNASSVQLVNSTFSANTGRGVCIEGYEATGLIHGCSFLAGGSYPVRLKATLAEMLASGNRYQANAVQRIGVSCSLGDDITDNDIWTRQTIPFELGAEETGQVLKVAAGGRLLIPAGSRVLSDGIECHGRLDINGASNGRCLFQPLVGNEWAGITLHPGSIGNLHFTTISEASTGLTADDVTLRINDTTIADSTYYGLRLTGSTALTLLRNVVTRSGRNGLRLEGTGLTGSIVNCSFNSSGSAPLWTLARNFSLLGTGNTYRGNAIERVGVSCGGNPDLASGSFTWTSQGIPLDLTVNPSGTVLNVGPQATLNVGAGQTLHSGGVVVRGTLNASGSGGAPVRFMPPVGQTSRGSWTGLQWNGGGGRLSSAIVELAQNGVNLTNASPTIMDCALTGSASDGLVCAGSSSPVVSRTRIMDNGRHGVYVTGSACPNLGNLSTASTADDGRNTLSGNGSYDLYNDTTNSLRAQRNQWGSTDEAAIRARIFDYADLPTRGAVLFSPLWQIAPNTPPVLSFIGAAGYENDGVTPEVGAPAKDFDFRVRYTDADDLPPQSVLLHVADGGEELPESPYAMAAEGATSYGSGAIFRRLVRFTGHGQYRYWFSATDSAGAAASGAPTLSAPGPIINTPPVLAWTAEAGYTGDGVEPNAGNSATNFVFRCRYRDADNDAPVIVQCHVLTAGGAEAPGSPVTMSTTQTTDYTRGRIYRAALRLASTGAYQCFFSASDGVSKARGPASATVAGPIVTAGGIAAVSGFTASCGGSGAVCFTWRQDTAARVDVTVTNLAGRTVARPCSDLALPAGAARVIWSGRGSHGTRLARGSYVVRLRSRQPDGTMVGMVAPLTIR
ncbi:MAG: right-handed parallel beta-helix repeat-containing protein [Armatimonadota bacterium]